MHFAEYLTIIFLLVIPSTFPPVLIYGHLYGTGVQQWLDDEKNVKIQFDYKPKKPEINNYNQLNFSIQDLKTGKHLKNLTASLTIPDSDPIYKFDNLRVADGDLGVICPFLVQGQHQVILSIRSENYALALASFNMTIP